jgi:hypothetical protein
MSEDSSASHALLAAALGGLLCVAASACSDATTPTNPNPPTSPDAPEMTDGSTSAFECDAGVYADAGVTSSTVESLTLADFTTQCNAQNGIVEIQPHCGGSNACRGMSYDIETQTLLVHTCRATNTCGGYSCIICD